MTKELSEKNTFLSYETQLTPVTEFKEEYNLNDVDIPNFPEGSIKYELNLIEFPIFSKNDKIEDHKSLTYIFSEENDEFLSIIPSNYDKAISNKVLQEFDEKIFYGLLRIYEITGNRKIITDYPSLLDISGIFKKGCSTLRVKDSLERMKGCQIIFNKVFYDAVAKSQGFDFTKRTKTINLISTLETVTFDRYEKMNQTEKGTYRKYFEKHGNLKEIAVITLNEDIILNMENHSHKYFKLEELLTIDNPTARKLYILLTKWKHWEKGPIRRTTKFLASRIPLSWRPTNIPGSVRSLENACKYLVNQGKISYSLDKSGGLARSVFTFTVLDNELSITNSTIGTEETGHEKLEIITTKEDSTNKTEDKNSFSTEQLDTITQICINSNGKLGYYSTLKTLEKYIGEDFNYLIWSLEKTIKKSKDNGAGYLSVILSEALNKAEYNDYLEAKNRPSKIKIPIETMDDRERKLDEKALKILDEMSEEQKNKLLTKYKYSGQTSVDMFLKITIKDLIFVDELENFLNTK